jgi:hypothetical protein
MKNEWLPSERRSPGRLASRALVGFLIAFCIGVAATLAWQSYGEVARETIASSSPQLGWLAPQAVPVAQTAPDMIAPVAPVDPSPDQQRLEAMSLDLSAMRQSVDHLAASLNILRKIASAPPPRPAAAPARNPAPLMPQAPPVGRVQ